MPVSIFPAPGPVMETSPNVSVSKDMAFLGPLMEPRNELASTRVGFTDASTLPPLPFFHFANELVTLPLLLRFLDHGPALSW